MNTRQQIIAARCSLVGALLCRFAQDSRGSISGRITDPQDAVLPGATVTLKSIASNVENTS
jgi:hypothetical protein